MAISIKIDGKIYTGWTSANISRRLDNISSSFSLSATTNPNVFPIKRGSKVEILIDNNLKILTGYISKISISISANSHTISVSGYSILNDLVKSKMKSSANYSGTKKLTNLIKKVFKELNLDSVKIINNLTDLKDFSANESIIPEVGESCYSFLERFGKKLQVFYRETIDGNLEIIRNESGEIKNKIILRFNEENKKILLATLSYDEKDLYNTYTGLSNMNISSDDADSQLLDLNSLYGGEGTQAATKSKATYSNSDIRNSLYYEFKAEENLKDDKLLSRVIWESNKRKALSESYSVEIQGHDFFNEVLDTNYLIAIKDEYCGIDKKMLIKSVEYSLSTSDGSKTKIECINKDAFKLNPIVINKTTDKKNGVLDEFNF